ARARGPGNTGMRSASQRALSAGTFSKSNVATSTRAANSARTDSSRQSPTSNGANWPAQASSTVSITRKRSPSDAPASAIMRASCPPPRIPTVVIAPRLPAGIVIGGDIVGLPLAEVVQRHADGGMLHGEDRGGEQGGVGRARLADRERRHRD